MRTSNPWNPWKIITVKGEMDVHVLPLLPDLRGGLAEQVVLDLRGVTFMDVRGFEAIVDRLRWVTQSGGIMRLVAPSRPVRRLLKVTATSDLFPTFDTLDRALHTPVGSP